jgi:hypothetical protein
MRLALLLLALSRVAGLTLPQDEQVKKIVPDAEKIKKAAKKLPPAAREKVEKALGEKLDAADLAVPVWEAYAPVPSVNAADKTLVRVLTLPGKGPKGSFKVGVAIASLDGTIHLVKVLDNADEKALESPQFLSQFAGYEYSPNLFSGPEVLQAAVAQAPKDKELDALLRMSTLMRAFGPVYERLRERIEKKDKGVVEDASSLEEMFDASHAPLSGASFLRASQVEKFKGFVQTGKAALAEIKAKAGAGSFDDAYRKAGELDSQSCSRCHGAYKRAFREARARRQIGNGYFTTKLDLAAPDPAATSSYDAFGKVLRKALLIAAEAK